MATNPQYTLTATTKDRSGEGTSIRAYQPLAVDLSAAAPVLITDFLTAFAAWTAFNAGNVINYGSNALRRANGGLQFGTGQREVKWEFVMFDNVTGAPYSATVPLALQIDQTVQGSDFLDNTVWAGTPIETTAEALFFSKDGNAGTLTGIKLVGRNN